MSQGFNKKGLCKLCKEPRTEYGDDPCIANLPGVLYACCGHGIARGYIKFADGRCLRFNPLEMELDLPQHEVKSPKVPVYVRGEPYRVLYYKSGKKKSRVGRYDITGTTRGMRVKVKRRKTDK